MRPQGCLQITKQNGLTEQEVSYPQKPTDHKMTPNNGTAHKSGCNHVHTTWFHRCKQGVFHHNFPFVECPRAPRGHCRPTVHQHEGHGASSVMVDSPYVCKFKNRISSCTHMARASPKASERSCASERVSTLSFWLHSLTSRQAPFWVTSPPGEK